MKFKIDSLDSVDESLQSEYEARDGAFYLKLEDAPKETDAQKELEKIREKNEQLLSETKKAKARAKAADEATQAEKDAAAQAAEELARKNNDLEGLEKAWQAKIDAQDSQISALKKGLESETVGKLAIDLAGKLAKDGASDLLLPHIERRLKSSIVDGVAKTLFLNENGSDSEMDLEQFVSSINDDPRFSQALRGTSASGTGFHTNPGGAGGLGEKPRSEMTPNEKSAFIAKHGSKAWSDKLKAEIK